MAKRRILAVTGIRSEYDIMSTVFRAIQTNSKLDLQIAVAGAHLSEDFGLTINEIIKDGFVVSDEILSLLNSNSLSGRVKGLGIQLLGIVQTVTRIKPDALLILGDREETISTALVGCYMNIPVFHIGGGDRVVGNVDDQVRHAVTKLSHIHFATNSESAERIIRLGEDPTKVFNTGNPGLDRYRLEPYLSCEDIFQRTGIYIAEGEPFVVMIQHVISTEVSSARIQIQETLEAINYLKVKTVIIYPNSDAGSKEIINEIESASQLPYIHLVKNLSRIDFVNIMRRASCILGNSSAGILEAPFLKLPAINVGNRQHGRLHSENVQFVGHDKKSIIEALNKALFDQEYRDYVKNCQSPYGDGYSSERIVELLASIELNEGVIRKDITY